MTAPTPSSPDPDHSRPSGRQQRARRARSGGGQHGSHRRGGPAGGDRSAAANGASGAYGRPDAPPYPEYPGHTAYDPAYPGGDRPGQAGHGPAGPGQPGYGGAEAGPAGADPAGPEEMEWVRPDARREVREGARSVLVVLLLGVGLGLLWLWLAPRVPLVGADGGVYLKDPEGEEAVGADGTFVLLAAGFGLVTGVVAFLRSRTGSVGVAVGLGVGALLGSVLAWQLGVRLGPSSDLAALAKAAGENKTFDGPLKLQAKGALLVWPFVGLLTHLMLTATYGDDEVQPVQPLPPEGAPQR